MNLGNLPLGPYIARRRLLIPQGPGKRPAVLPISRDDVFSFDGDEPVDVCAMVRMGRIAPYLGDVAALERAEALGKGA